MVLTARVLIRAAAAFGAVVLLASVSSLALAVMPMGAPKGQVQVVVRLTDPPLAAALGVNAKRTGVTWGRDQQRAYVAQLNAKQDAVMAQVKAMGGTELARLSKAENAVIVQVDAQHLPSIAKLPGVTKLRPVIDYQVAVSDTTVPYIGATALQALGIDGTGIRVGVLDSGIDYTHFDLGGPGTLAAYEACYGTSPADSRNTIVTSPCVFPTSKVIGGYDFVGEVWPNGPLAPDPNPIAAPAPNGLINFTGVDGSHGTHVSDILAGKSSDGSRLGVAPGALLYAIKVCSSVSTSCSGVALLQGVEFALDPDGDGDLTDAVDIMSLSLGQDYGQREDDLSEALATAVHFGVVVVTAAGNGGDFPYILSSPSSTPEIISVAQTQDPSALAFPFVVNSPPAIAGTYTNTTTVDWAPISSTVTGNVSYIGRGCPGDTYLDNPSGKVALIDRGTCAVSLKVDGAVKAGATGALIALIAPGDAISFSYGGGTSFAPTLVITQAEGNTIKSQITAPVNVTMSPNVFIPLVGSIVSSSARGPSISYVAVKPDIGAPGATISAVSGGGTLEGGFGGTSGATPMISGSAALLLSANHSLTPGEVKAKLMNSAETNIFLNPATAPGVLAPITRIGSGEVRVDRANKITLAAWDAVDPAGISLSFGYNALTGTQHLMKKVYVQNYAGSARTLTITPSFRDEASSAVTLSAPPTVTVPANGATSFVFSLTVDASKLPTWPWDNPGDGASNAGSEGGLGPLLTVAEAAGYLTLADATDTIHLPWHILPHKADNLKVGSTSLALGGGTTGTISVSNLGGAIPGAVDTFALTGTSPRIPSADLPKPGDNFAVIDLRAAGVRANGSNVEFAINTYGSRSAPVYPAEFDIYIDSNNSGTPDYVLFNNELGGFGATGETVVNVVNLSTGIATPIAFANVDFNSANIVFSVPMAAVGLAPGQKFNFAVLAFDNYFTGNLTDVIGTMVVTLGAPRYSTDGGTGFVSTFVPAGGSVPITVTKVAGGAAGSPSQIGILLKYRDAKPGSETDLVTVTP
jgi:minor extracellular serine protease Vpr